MAKERILVVEDDVAIKQLLSLMCLKADYTLVKASNGKEGLAALENNKNHIDLIISDIIMDEMNGFEFIKAVKSNINYKTVPFIFFSGKTESADRIMGLKLGADDYVTKPCSRDELAIKVRILLEKNAAIRKSTIAGLAGNLRNTSVRELLQILDITRRTGILVITSDTISGALYFKNGFLINASIGDQWGEEAAVKLLCIHDGSFRFEINPVGDISTTINLSREELLAYCNLNNTSKLVTMVDKDKRLSVIAEAATLISPDETGIFQLVSHNPGITVSEIEKLFGEYSLHAISNMLEKGFLIESEPPIISSGTPDTNTATVDINTIDELLDKFHRYETKHDLSAIHFGLIGNKTDTESFLYSLVSEGHAKAEQIKFEQGNSLIEIPNYSLIKLIFGIHMIYFHTLAPDHHQHFLWDAIYNNTVGTVILNNADTKNISAKFITTAQNKQHPYIIHDMDNKELNFPNILNIINKLL